MLLIVERTCPEGRRLAPKDPLRREAGRSLKFQQPSAVPLCFIIPVRRQSTGAQNFRRYHHVAAHQ